MSIAHINHIRYQLVGKLSVAQKLAALGTFPRTCMDFINVYRIFGMMIGFLILYPFVVLPLIAFYIIEFRGIVGTCFKMKSIRIAFVQSFSPRGIDTVLIVIKFTHYIGNKAFPNSGFADFAHRICFRVPIVEISHNRNSGCVRRPDTEHYSKLTEHIRLMRAEKIVSSRSRACMKVIQKTLNNAVNHSFISPFGIMPYGTAAVKFCLAGQSAKP